MAQVVLQLKVLGVVSPMDFPYISPPSIAILKKALEMLFLLGALNKVIVKVIVRCTFVIFLCTFILTFISVRCIMLLIYYAIDILCCTWIMLLIFDKAEFPFLLIWIFMFLPKHFNVYFSAFLFSPSLLSFPQLYFTVLFSTLLLPPLLYCTPHTFFFFMESIGSESI